MSHFGKTNQIIIGILLAFLVYFIFRLNRIGKSVFIAGFSCLALEMVIMVIYQALCGTIYRGSGIIISMFMAGMALGFWIKLPDSEHLPRWMSNVLLFMAAICLLPVDEPDLRQQKWLSMVVPDKQTRTHHSHCRCFR
jgi:peptidoglycan/LPS O-acetylase OafA/YrhL